MSGTIRGYLEGSVRTKQDFLIQAAADLDRAAGRVRQVLESGGKILLFGNGGSAADAQHVAAEFVGRFEKERPGLAALALNVNASVLTCVGNDYSFDEVFSRQIEALGRRGDLAWGFTTSGKSANVCLALKAACQRGLHTLVFSGRDGGEAARLAELAVVVRADRTSWIQECHITAAHAICAAVDGTL